MRIRTLIAAAAAALAVGAFGWSSNATAQSSPSADQIIKALQPTGSMKGGTRGIRPAAPAAPTAVQPAAAQAPAAAPTASAAPMHTAATTQAAPAPAAGPSINLTIQFQNGSAELTPEATKTLNALGQALSSSDLAGYRFRIEGHTDTVGSKDYNLNLSQMRARKVAEYLEKNFGVGTSRVEAVGRGSEAPLVPTPDQTAEPRNRRVQVINLGA